MQKRYEQLVIQDLPKRKGGARPGAGKPSRWNTNPVKRVLFPVEFLATLTYACSLMDEGTPEQRTRFRELLGDIAQRFWCERNPEVN